MACGRHRLVTDGAIAAATACSSAGASAATGVASASYAWRRGRTCATPLRVRRASRCAVHSHGLCVRTSMLRSVSNSANWTPAGRKRPNQLTTVMRSIWTLDAVHERVASFEWMTHVLACHLRSSLVRHETAEYHHYLPGGVAYVAGMHCARTASRGRHGGGGGSGGGGGGSSSSSIGGGGGGSGGG